MNAYFIFEEDVIAELGWELYHYGETMAKYLVAEHQMLVSYLFAEKYSVLDVAGFVDWVNLHSI